MNKKTSTFSWQGLLKAALVDYRAFRDGYLSANAHK